MLAMVGRIKEWRSDITLEKQAWNDGSSVSSAEDAVRNAGKKTRTFENTAKITKKPRRTSSELRKKAEEKRREKVIEGLLS